MTLESIVKSIETEPGVLLYFSGENCNVCHALRPKFRELFDRSFPMIRQIYLDAGEHPEIAAHFQVFSVPTAIVFLGGREFTREGRAVSLHALEEKLSRPYGILTES
ncbi:thioredoxin family protein [Nitratifractor sp.]